MEKYLKPILKAEKENVNLGTRINHHHDACRSLTLVHSKVSKHSNYTTYFTNSTVKATQEPTIGNHDHEYLDN